MTWFFFAAKPPHNQPVERTAPAARPLGSFEKLESRQVLYGADLGSALEPSGPEMPRVDQFFSNELQRHQREGREHLDVRHDPRGGNSAPPPPPHWIVMIDPSGRAPLDIGNNPSHVNLPLSESGLAGGTGRPSLPELGVTIPENLSSIVQNWRDSGDRSTLDNFLDSVRQAIDSSYLATDTFSVVTSSYGEVDWDSLLENQEQDLAGNSNSLGDNEENSSSSQLELREVDSETPDDETTTSAKSDEEEESSTHLLRKRKPSLDDEYASQRSAAEDSSADWLASSSSAGFVAFHHEPTSFELRAEHRQAQLEDRLIDDSLAELLASDVLNWLDTPTAEQAVDVTHEVAIRQVSTSSTPADVSHATIAAQLQSEHTQAIDEVLAEVARESMPQPIAAIVPQNNQ